ncbi:MAG TPA: TPM domain-containing protein [Candidatus Cybelea sp.]
MKLQRSIPVIVLLMSAWTLPGLAQEFKVPPTPDHFVTDNADALSGSTRGSLENELSTYEKATGHQLIVWIGDTTGDVPLETYTTNTAHQWRIGRRGHDDGAILFLFMKDHKIRIEVGYGLESSLTDADSYRIIQDVIRPKMRAGDVDGAVSGGIAAMIKTITPSYAGVTPPPSETENTAPPAVVAILLIVFGFAGLLMVFVIVMIIVRMVGGIRYGYLVLREGSKKAKADMKNSAFWGSSAIGFVGDGSSSGGGGFDSGGFDTGGGDFGGGGASGSW